LSKLPPKKVFEDNIDEFITKAVSKPGNESSRKFVLGENVLSQEALES